MKRSITGSLLALALIAGPARASSPVGIQALPNPVALGQRVAFTVQVAVHETLQVWVSAKGFAQPSMGSLPPGSWQWECCPAETAGTAAWHYRSASRVAPGSYRFPAATRNRGTYLSTARVSSGSAGVWVRIV